MRIAETVLVVLLAASAGCGRSKAQQALPPARGAGAPPLPALPVIPASGKGDQATLVAPSGGRTTGTTFPRAEAQVGPNAGGVIARILVREGDRVRRGQVLFRLDARDASLRVAQARAALEAARVSLKATEVEHQRTKAMVEQKAMNQMQWDQIQARLDGARVGVQQAEVGVAMAEKALADATVHAPIEGVVAAKLKNEGEMATMMPPTVVLVLQDPSVLELRFRLPEAALARVKPGDAVRARFEALGVEREARVSRIQPAVDPRTRTVELVAEIPNKDGALRSGLLASVELAAAAAVPAGR